MVLIMGDWGEYLAARPISPPKSLASLGIGQKRGAEKTQ